MTVFDGTAKLPLEQLKEQKESLMRLNFNEELFQSTTEGFLRLRQ